ncbi:MAG: SDR family NAD(P)-dependent oxidoreductase [Anaerolineae bacterium]
MELALADRVALVTGAGEGIGKATAIKFAQAGAKVALVGRTLAPMEKVAATIRKSGGQALAIKADVSRPSDMEAAVERAGEVLGTITTVMANAGINGLWAPLEQLSPDDWDETLNINLKGTFLTVKYALPHLKKAGGSVIIVSSVNGTRMFSNTGASAYATSKAGQVAFAKMIALELAPSRVRVNVICPGAIETSIDDNTEQKDLKKVKTPVEFPKGAIPLTGGASGKAEQVADLALFLASDASSHISGTEVWIDGAQSLLQG